VLFLLLAPAFAVAQDFIEVRPAEPVDAVPVPEVRRAEAVAPAATALPGVDATDGTEAIRAAPSNRTDDPARQTYEQANARVHRQGQVNKCTVIQLQGSAAEKRVYAVLDRKIDIHTKIVDLYNEILDS
jgi:hypothetical protein